MPGIMSNSSTSRPGRGCVGIVYLRNFAIDPSRMEIWCCRYYYGILSMQFLFCLFLHMCPSQELRARLFKALICQVHLAGSDIQPTRHATQPSLRGISLADNGVREGINRRIVSCRVVSCLVVPESSHDERAGEVSSRDVQNEGEVWNEGGRRGWFAIYQGRGDVSQVELQGRFTTARDWGAAAEGRRNTSIYLDNDHHARTRRYGAECLMHDSTRVTG